MKSFAVADYLIGCRPFIYFQPRSKTMFNYKAAGTPVAAKKLANGHHIVMIALEHNIGDHAVVHYITGSTSWEFAYGYCSDYGKAEQLFDQKCRDLK